MRLDQRAVMRVTRTRTQAKASYDRMSPFYDCIAGIYEQKYKNMALKRLNVTQGEVVLEVGFGTGHCLRHMAEAVGETGKVYGIDISSGMLAVSRRRLEKAGLGERVELVNDDALKMPYAADQFDAVFTSFTLELFDSPEIPQVLAEVKRVLKPAGRLGVISMSKGEEDTKLLRLYEWLHTKIPEYVDCRPIFVQESVENAGFHILNVTDVSLMGLSGQLVLAEKLSSPEQ